MATPARARAANKYGVSNKYLRLAEQMNHSSQGTPDELVEDSRRTYESWRDSRDRANSRVKE